MTQNKDYLLAGLRSARPDPDYRPSPHSSEATAMLAGILGGDHPDEAHDRRRVTRRKIVQAAIPVVAATMVAAGFLMVTGAPSNSDLHLSAAAVGTAILDALQQESGDILRVSTTSKTTNNEIETDHRWVYPAFPVAGQQVRYRVFKSYAGRPYQDVESVYTETADMDRPILNTNQGPRSGKIIGVDYHSRTWARFRADSVPADAIGFSPALIRSEIASGSFHVEGAVELNGRKTVKVGFFNKPSGWHVTLWVDAHTYIPLRSLWFSWWGPGTDITTTTTYAYQVLPATPASLKLLDPVIPAGFTKSATIPGF